MGVIEGHPFAFVRMLRRLLPLDSKVEFGVYQYVPQTIADERRFLKLPLRDLTVWRFQELANELSPRQEMALHSRVVLGDGCSVAHIPMIDFATDDLRLIVRNVGAVMMELGLPAPYIFESGRSFHGYVPALLPANDWPRFMGALLLVNQPGFEPVVDSRWIGHRLLAGYASLRWTRNSPHYLSTPRRVRRALAIE